MRSYSADTAFISALVAARAELTDFISDLNWLASAVIFAPTSCIAMRLSSFPKDQNFSLTRLSKPLSMMLWIAPSSSFTAVSIQWTPGVLEDPYSWMKAISALEPL